MKETEHLNAPVKNCATCVHSKLPSHGMESYRLCIRFQCYCETSVLSTGFCTPNLNHWRAKAACDAGPESEAVAGGSALELNL